MQIGHEKYTSKNYHREMLILQHMVKFAAYGNTASRFNRLQSGVANHNESAVGVEVGVSELSRSGSMAGQASEVTAVGRQMDMVVPFLEPMVCV